MITRHVFARGTRARKSGFYSHLADASCSSFSTTPMEAVHSSLWLLVRRLHADALAQGILPFIIRWGPDASSRLAPRLDPSSALWHEGGYASAAGMGRTVGGCGAVSRISLNRARADQRARARRATEQAQDTLRKAGPRSRATSSF